VLCRPTPRDCPAALLVAMLPVSMLLVSVQLLPVRPVTGWTSKLG
jgi:hypothetical protein